MRLDQATVDAILDRRVKLRTLMVPFERGRHGELLRPFREDRSYVLRGPEPYVALLERARRMPDRARAVLWLYDRTVTVEATRVQITVIAPPIQLEDCWSVSFALGDITDDLDHPRLLAASSPLPQRCKCGKLLVGLTPGQARCPDCGRDLPKDREDDHGYTRRPGRALPNEPEAVPKSQQARFTEQAEQRRTPEIVAAWERHRARLQESIDDMRSFDLDEAARDRFKALEKQVAALDRLLNPLDTTRAA